MQRYASEMLRRYSFLPVFLALFLTLNWWSGQIQNNPFQENTPISRDPKVDSELASIRTELIEALDRLVTYQLYHRASHGHFTKVLSHLGYSVSKLVSDRYAIRVVEANGDHFLIEAFSEENGRLNDLVQIDQNFRVNANFRLPPPRPEFLQAQALRHIREIRQAAHEVPENGIYQGYFRYVFGREQAQGHAVGVRAPVLGMEVTLSSSDLDAIRVAKTNEDISFAPHLTGEWSKSKERSKDEGQDESKSNTLSEWAAGVESVETLTRVSEISQAQPLEVERISGDSGNSGGAVEPLEIVPEKAISDRYMSERSIAGQKDSPR